MYIFIILVILLLLQALFIPSKTKEWKRLYLILAFIEMQLVSGFRVAEDGDTYYYGLYFSEMAGMSFNEAITIGTEFGYYLFCFVLSRFSSDPQTIIFFSAALVNLLVLKFIYKRSETVWLSVIIYITFMFFLSSVNAIRNSIAYTILLYSNDYILKRKLKYFFLIVVLAGSFHFSALFYFPIYFLYQLDLNKRSIIIVSVTVLLLMSFLSPILTMLVAIHPRWSSYAENDFYQSAFANVLIFLVQSSLVLLAIKRESTSLSRLRGSNKLYMLLMLMSVIMAFCAIDVMMISRFVTIFSIISIIYIPNLLVIPGKKSLHTGWVSLVLIVSFTQMVVILTFRPEWYFVGEYSLSFLK